MVSFRRGCCALREDQILNLRLSRSGCVSPRVYIYLIGFLTLKGLYETRDLLFILHPLSNDITITRLCRMVLTRWFALAGTAICKPCLMASPSLSRDDRPRERHPICDRLMGKAVQLRMLMTRDNESSQPDLEHVLCSVQEAIHRSLLCPFNLGSIIQGLQTSVP
jgi:hypothetical protein